MKTCMYLFLPVLAFLFISFDSFSQEILDTAKIYTSLEEALKHPEAVYHLNLSKKKLKIYPAELSKLVNLRDLNLDHNKLKVLPKEIGDLKNLETLSAASNKLEEISSDIGKLTNLKALNLGRNNIVIIPESIGNLVNLEMLDIWDNNLNPLPDEISKLKNLKKLELRGILFSAEEHVRLKGLLPNTEIMLSPSCNCKN